MATLNIKGFPDDLYGKLQARARREHRSVAQQVIRLLEQALAEPESMSILVLQGLGAEMWAGVDAADHVKRERRSWD